MSTRFVEKNEEDKIIELMAVLLELKEESVEVVTRFIHENGLKVFFKSVESLDIDDEEKERVLALKQVVDAKEKEIANREGDA